jgi:putative redox protein
MSNQEYKLRLRQIGSRKLEVVSDKWSFVVDLKEEFGGENSGPDPSELVAAALAACEVLTGVAWASRRHATELQDVEAEVTWEYGEKPERISSINVVIKNVADRLGENTAAFKAIVKGCTISKTLKVPPELELEVE